MKPGLSLRVSQHLALTPQLQQSIRLLRRQESGRVGDFGTRQGQDLQGGWGGWFEHPAIIAQSA